jgi:hypothetical protein
MNTTEATEATEATVAGDFSWMKDSHSAAMLTDAYQAITAAEQWFFFRYEEPPPDRGYMFWNTPELTLVQSKMRDPDVHSGASYAWTMREMQAIAKLSWEGWVVSRRGIGW